LLFSSCAHLKDRQGLSSSYETSARAPSSDEIEEEIEITKEHLEKDQFIEPELSQNVPPQKIKTQLNKAVAKWIQYFTKNRRNRDRFQRFIDRGARYKEIVTEVLKENNLPYELYYLPVIESGYQNHARSIASAVGTWQFIRGTAQRYGLTVNKYVDERRDPIRATEAATKYLRDLNMVFNDWYLAMASYNAGEMRVFRAIMKGKSRNYWELSDMKMLPRETRNYVPKFIAAVLIGENPERYGLRQPPKLAFPNVELAEVPGALELKHVAKLASISLSELKEHNPHLKRGLTPPGKSYSIWVPQGKDRQIARVQTRLAKLANSRLPANLPVSTQKYRVRRGDNLSEIARRFGTGVRTLKKLNRLRSSRIYVGQRLKVSGTQYIAKTKHTVQRGENLSVIARKYGLSVSYLKRINSLRSSRIIPGQTLKTAASEARSLSRYRVQKGDNLHLIARRVGVSISHLRKSNNITSSHIYAGQTLKY